MGQFKIRSAQISEISLNTHGLAISASARRYFVWLTGQPAPAQNLQNLKQPWMVMASIDLFQVGWLQGDKAAGKFTFNSRMGEVVV